MAETAGTAAEDVRASSSTAAAVDRPLVQIAPMMEVTYRDFRYFMRLLTRRSQLWTEMVVDETLLHNLEPVKCDKFLAYHPKEHPIVCQLGGSDPSKLARAAEVVERYGYDEVNLNVGCPSCRVAQKGEFGCSLMLRKEVVRDIIHSMSRAVQIPVTVKCRLGADEHDSPEFTEDFVRTVAQGGCKHFIIHARKAWLNGLSPAQNRSVPPLHYPRILDLCRKFPDLSFSLNGGILDLGHVRALLGFPNGLLPGESEDMISSAWGWPGSDTVRTGPVGSLPANLMGIMLGRAAMNTPTLLWDADRVVYGEPAPEVPLTRRSLLEAYRDYLAEVHLEGDAERSVGAVHQAVKPTLGLFSGLRGNKAWRNTMDSLVRVKANRDIGPAYILGEAMKVVEDANPGLMDEPLPSTLPYKPTDAPKGHPSSPVPTPNGTPCGTPRGRKRKGNQGTLPASLCGKSTEQEREEASEGVPEPPARCNEGIAVAAA